eukprot:9480853-Pyramimonas_sp.AAC.1
MPPGGSLALPQCVRAPQCQSRVVFTRGGRTEEKSLRARDEGAHVLGGLAHLVMLSRSAAAAAAFMFSGPSDEAHIYITVCRYRGVHGRCGANHSHCRGSFGAQRHGSVHTSILTYMEYCCPHKQCGVHKRCVRSRVVFELRREKQELSILHQVSRVWAQVRCVVIVVLVLILLVVSSSSSPSSSTSSMLYFSSS